MEGRLSNKWPHFSVRARTEEGNTLEIRSSKANVVVGPLLEGPAPPDERGHGPLRVWPGSLAVE